MRAVDGGPFIGKHGHCPLRGEKPPFVLSWSQLENRELQDKSVLDIAPTLCEVFHLPHETMQGENLLHLNWMLNDPTWSEQKSALLRRLFMPAAKKMSSAHSLAHPFEWPYLIWTKRCHCSVWVGLFYAWNRCVTTVSGFSIKNALCHLLNTNRVKSERKTCNRRDLNPTWDKPRSQHLAPFSSTQDNIIP